MTAVVIEVQRYRDGRRFPVGGTRSPDDLQRAIELVHRMRCRDGLSFRQIVAELASEHGLRVSLGSVHHYATAWACERCQDR